MNRKRKIKERIRRSDLFLFCQLNTLFYLLNTLLKTPLTKIINVNYTSNQLTVHQLQMNTKQQIIERLSYQTVIGKMKYKLLEIVRQFKKLDYKRWAIQWINKIITSSTASHKIELLASPLKDTNELILPLEFALIKLVKCVVNKYTFYTNLVYAIKPYISSLYYNNIKQENMLINSSYSTSLWNQPIHPVIFPQVQMQYLAISKKLDGSYGWAQEYDRSSNTSFIYNLDVRKLKQLQTKRTSKLFYLNTEFVYRQCLHTVAVHMQKIMKKNKI